MLSKEKIEEIKKQLQGLSPEEQEKKFQEILATLAPEEQEALAGKQQCPFCLMAQGEIPVKKVYEDATVLAILDIHPANKGHTLLFPREHARVLNTVPDVVVQHLFSVANKISSAIFDAVGAEGTNIVVANGSAAGQTAPHVLVNIIPRFAQDKVSIGWKGENKDEKEMDTVLDAIVKKIPKEKPKIEKKVAPLSVSPEEFRIP